MADYSESLIKSLIKIVQNTLVSQKKK